VTVAVPQERDSDVPRVPASRVVCGLLAAGCAVLVLVLLQRSPTVTVPGQTEPSTLHATCSSVWLMGLPFSGYEGTERDYSYTVDVDSYSASTQAQDFTEAECGRLRTRYTAESALLIVPMLWLAWLAFRRRNHDDEIARLTREVDALRRRLDKQAAPPRTD